MAHAAVFLLNGAILELMQISAKRSCSDIILMYEQYENFSSFLSKIFLLPCNKIVDVASERRVKDAAQQLQDLIDSHVSDLLLHSDHRSESDDFTLSFSQQLSQVKQEVSSFLAALESTEQQQQQQQNKSSSDYSSTGKQQDPVGLDEQIKGLKEWIQHPRSSLQVTSVVGMTGIGKTTLVKQVYNDPHVVDEFETHLFVHIGPRYTKLEEIMLLVLNQLGVFPPTDKLLHKNKDYLKNQLLEALSRQKYLIVLDDVWASTSAWHEIEHSSFPINGNGSRIIIISQIQSLSHSLAVHKRIIPLPFLNDDDSWKLLHQTAFSSGYKCSSELEKIGKKIAKNCQGLPAAIIQVGENLRGKLIQEWMTLAENEDPLVITRNDDTPLSKALYFSYMMLPQYLKVFFLYMGVFPKKHAISRSMLMKLWVSEGFLQAGRAEKTAGEYLDRLICQNVVLIEKKASVSIETTKNCSMHFTFRSLCVNEANSEKLFHVVKKYIDCIPEKLRGQHRFCVHNNVVLAFREVHEWMESVPNARTLLCFGPKQQYPIALPLCFRLLKILDALAVRFYEFPHQVFPLIHLRYLAITCDGELPNSISRLLNLEVLIFSQHHNIKLLKNGPAYLPIGIWKLRKLKQLYCMGFDLPAPPSDDSNSVLENLVTLSGVSVHSCTVEVLSKIPMLKRVAVQIESTHDSVDTFSFFSPFTSLYQEFESFKCVVVNPNLRPPIVPCVPNFPVNIKKISLSGCGFPWKKIEVLSALPNLKVLKLRWYAFRGPIWEISSLEFPKLKFLLLEDLDIEHWELYGHIQGMDKVIVRHCYKLKSFPDNLKFTNLVEVDDCNLSFMKKMRRWRSVLGFEAKINSSITPL